MELFAKKIEKQLASYQQELIETHYREVDNMYRQIRGWRHDYRNHIQTMKAYAAQGDLEARNLLVEHNLRLVAHVAKKLRYRVPSFPSGVSPSPQPESTVNSG